MPEVGQVLSFTYPGPFNLPSVQTDPAKVDARSQAFLRQYERWVMIDDLLGGTRRMRAAAERWLPSETKERPDAYRVRLERSYLYPGTKDTLEKIVAKPFSRDVRIVGTLPAELDDIEHDVDLHGTNLTQFARQLFFSGIARGHAHVFVDFPRVSRDRTLADDRAGKIRPYFSLVHAHELFGYRYLRAMNGSKVLTQTRIHERREAVEGAWGESSVDTLRVWNAPPLDSLTGQAATGAKPGSWELWTKAARDIDYKSSENGEHTYPGVPLVTFYAEPVGLMESAPPLEELAWLNVAHWQSSSDQRNLLRYARAPILAISGERGNEDTEIVIGPLNALRMTDPAAKAVFVEHSGKAIGAGQADIDHIEEQMATLGVQPLLRRSGTRTATERAIEESKSQSAVQAWTGACEAALEQAYRIAAQWQGVELPADFRVDIFHEFSLAETAERDIEALIKARAAREISRKTFLVELKRRTLLADNVDVEQEMAALEKESAAEADDVARAMAAVAPKPPVAEGDGEASGGEPVEDEDDAEGEDE